MFARQDHKHELEAHRHCEKCERIIEDVFDEATWNYRNDLKIRICNFCKILYISYWNKEGNWVEHKSLDIKEFLSLNKTKQSPK